MTREPCFVCGTSSDGWRLCPDCREGVGRVLSEIKQYSTTERRHRFAAAVLFAIGHAVEGDRQRGQVAW